MSRPLSLIGMLLAFFCVSFALGDAVTSQSASTTTASPTLPGCLPPFLDGDFGPPRPHHRPWPHVPCTDYQGVTHYPVTRSPVPTTAFNQFPRCGDPLFMPCWPWMTATPQPDNDINARDTSPPPSPQQAIKDHLLLLLIRLKQKEHFHAGEKGYKKMAKDINNNWDLSRIDVNNADQVRSAVEGKLAEFRAQKLISPREVKKVLAQYPVSRVAARDVSQDDGIPQAHCIKVGFKWVCDHIRPRCRGPGCIPLGHGPVVFPPGCKGDDCGFLPPYLPPPGCKGDDCPTAPDTLPIPPKAVEISPLGPGDPPKDPSKFCSAGCKV